MIEEVKRSKKAQFGPLILTVSAFVGGIGTGAALIKKAKNLEEVNPTLSKVLKVTGSGMIIAGIASTAFLPKTIKNAQKSIAVKYEVDDAPHEVKGKSGMQYFLHCYDPYDKYSRCGTSMSPEQYNKLKSANSDKEKKTCLREILNYPLWRGKWTKKID